MSPLCRQKVGQGRQAGNRAQGWLHGPACHRPSLGLIGWPVTWAVLLGCEKASARRSRTEARSPGYMAQLLGVLPLLLPALPAVEFKTRLVPGEPFGAFCNSQL